MAEGDLTITGKELASLIGCKPSYVVELRKKGRVVVGAGGKGFLKAASLELYARTADPVYAGVAQRHADERGSSLVGSGEGANDLDADIDDEDEDGDDDDDDDARTARPGRPQTPDSARKAKALACPQHDRRGPPRWWRSPSPFARVPTRRTWGSETPCRPPRPRSSA